MIPGPRDTDAAIVGMACLFPGAPDLETYRRNLDEGVDAIVEAPPDRIDPVFYDPDSDALDRHYCNRGGFVDEHARFDPLRWGLMPVTAEGSEPESLLALEVAAAALADAGYGDRGEHGMPREATAVILGRGGYPGPRMMGMIQMARSSLEVQRSVEHLVPGLDPEQLDEVRRSYQREIEGMRSDTVIGVTPNLVASRIANRLDLHGPAYTIDAACASSLVAVDRGVGDLASGRADLVLAGGVHLHHGEGLWSVFCQMGAMSRRQECRPFDRDADGMLVGEGIGVVVLKRLTDARRDGDRVYAVIRGTGLSSDGRASSVMNPRSESQVMAIERAWKAAGLDPTAPGSVGYMEAHGTGTPVGDETELHTLAEVFGRETGSSNRPGLGSVKSMIGHTMPAAGIAGLIKVALAVHEARRYPTLHVHHPHPGLDETRFRLQTESESWEDREGPRRAGVNAFGFGGINGHVVLEALDTTPTAVRGAGRRRRTRALLIAGRDPGEVLEALDRGVSRTDAAGPSRLAVLDPDPERVARASEIVARGERHAERDGSIAFTPRGLRTDGGGIAFVFPGVEGEFEADLADLATELGVPCPPSVGSDDLETMGAVIIQVNRMMDRALRDGGIEPDMVAGHSIGEWSALVSSGVISESTVDHLIETLQPGSLETPGVVFAAVGGDLDRIGRALQRFPEVHVSLENCPHQTVVCGPEEDVEALVKELRKERVSSLVLPFRSGFHTPHFIPYLDPMRSIFEDLDVEAPRETTWSTATCEPFPDDPDGIRERILEQLVRPVRFRSLIERMYAEGTRVFVQPGQGNLPGFVRDTLRGRPHLALTAIDPRRSGFEQLGRMAGPLWAEGGTFDVHAFLEPVGEDDRPGPGNGRPPGERLFLGAKVVHATGPLRTPLGTPASPEKEIDAEDPILATFERSMREIERARRDVEEAWRTKRRSDRLAPRSSTTRRRLSLEDQPYLRDHSFFDLPDGWPDVTDGFPNVPMTMSISMMIEAAADLVPEREVVGVREVRAFRWIELDEPRTVEIEAAFDGDGEVSVRIGEAVEGRVILADRYPAPPPSPLSPGEVWDLDLSTVDMYRDRFMFHGPAYRSVERLVETGPRGIRGRVRRLPAEGSLLDATGQLIGFWIVWTASDNPVSYPMLIDTISFYGPAPEVGEELGCVGRIRHYGERQVRADVDFVLDDGSVWARVEGFLSRRNRMEASMESVVRGPGRHALARPLTEVPDACWFDADVSDATTRDYFAGLYLNGREREAYGALPDREKEPWLRARIAAKDAVRHRLWRDGHGDVYPIEVEIHGSPPARASVWNDPDVDLHVITARAGDVVVARAGDGPVGIRLRRPGDGGADPGPIEGKDIRTTRHGEWIIDWTEEE